MKIYKLDTQKSKIQWNASIDHQTIEGNLNIEKGSFLAELGEVIKGNISVDLSTLTFTDRSLNHDELKALKQYLDQKSKSRPDRNLINFRIDRVQKIEGNEVLKGVVTYKNKAFGIDMKISSETLGDRFQASGEVHLDATNPTLAQEVREELSNISDIDDNELSDLKFKCELLGTPSD